MTTDSNSPSPQGSSVGGSADYQYSVDGARYHSQTSSITGAQIKAKIPNFNPTFQLFLESTGSDPDKPIGDADAVDLSGTPKRFYTAPPATFGLSPMRA